MQFDFSKLAIPQASKPQSDPYKIFTGLPRLGGAPNDLWKGQSDALSQWNEHRKAKDVLVSLNTGGGKTLVGLLIAKSLCNEGIDNVVYVCPTNDLVKQTAGQAQSIGIDVTTRIDGSYSNDLFEVGKTFCITNYHALFGGLSSIRRKYFPGAVIFDDAHVAEASMRDSFTLTIKQEQHQNLHSSLRNLFLPVFRELGREGEYRDSFTSSGSPHAVLVPPHAVMANLAQLELAFRAADASNDKHLKYSFAHLKDHLSVCAIVIRSGIIEITPPFLPSLALDIFDRPIRRIYLSATLQNKADMVRAFGREPEVKIEPDNDAGNGERLILSERELINAKIDCSFGKTLSQKHKLLVAVPSYTQAKLWESLAAPPNVKTFSEELEIFRVSSGGAFVLVNRVDGIDLPHDTCRLMLLDGIPRSEGLLERYQFEYLQMKTFASSRIANRLVQLFGRINRGRSDYGAFLIAGRELNIWLANDKNVALLPRLLRQQIFLGRNVQNGMNIKTIEAVSGLIDSVILSKPRDQGWLNYYSQFINAQDVNDDQNERARLVEERNLAAAKAEALYARAVWQRNYSAARIVLDEVVADTARADEKLAGWHNLWIGAAYAYEGLSDEAFVYFVRARGQLGLNLAVPVGPSVGEATFPKATRRVVANALMLTNLGRESFNKQIATLNKQLIPLDGGTPAQMEEAARLLGQTLGFTSTRPDNEDGTGPDVFWKDVEAQLALGVELKTDKNDGSSYSKADIGQALDHLSWIDANLEGCTSLGCVLVGPAVGHMDQANPTKNLYHVETKVMSMLKERILAILRDAYEQPVASRADYIDAATQELSLGNLGSILMARPFVPA